MNKIIKSALLSAAFLLSFAANNAFTEGLSNDKVVIGVMSDMSGHYADTAGPGSLLAAQMAVEDFGGEILGKKIEVLAADHQHKPDQSAAIARRWFDIDGVDAIFDINQTAVHLSVAKIAEEKNRLIINTSAASSTITGIYCSKNVIHYSYDTYATTLTSVDAVMAQHPELKKWFIIAVDYAFGESMSQDIERVVKANGGEVIGVVKHPLNTTDFSSFVLQAQASGADYIALANASNDTMNAIRSAYEFQLMQNQIIVAPILFITDVKNLGLDVTKGMYTAPAFYWDRTDETREFSRRFLARHGTMPTFLHAGTYSGVLTYLKAIQKIGTDDWEAVRTELGKTRINDMFASDGYIRPDGRMIHDMYLAKVKSPEESKETWDLYQILQTVPGDKAFRPMSEGGCPLIKN